MGFPVFLFALGFEKFWNAKNEYEAVRARFSGIWLRAKDAHQFPYLKLADKLPQQCL